MSELTAPAARALEPPAIPLRALGPWILFAISLFGLMYLVGFEQGAAALTQGTVVHEFFHDGRHFLAFPCH
jgi:Probable cobalt transporter subunit (CbtB)